MPLVGGFSRASPVSLRPFIPALLKPHLTSPSSAAKTPIVAMRGRGERQTSEKTRRSMASSITCENPGAIPQGIVPSSPRWEASSLTTTSLRPPLLTVLRSQSKGVRDTKRSCGVVCHEQSRGAASGRHANYSLSLRSQHLLRSAIATWLMWRVAKHENERMTWRTGGEDVIERETNKYLRVHHAAESVRLLAYHLCEPGSIPGGVVLGFPQVGIVPDNAAGRRVFSGISRFPHPWISALLQRPSDRPGCNTETSCTRRRSVANFQTVFTRWMWAQHRFRRGAMLRKINDPSRSAAASDSFRSWMRGTLSKIAAFRKTFTNC
ncbi:hypothetical protein PR048_027162 [Dryococelus australis]|uniref:Uncharacterized protein n=1 Tax=Dryococelus australis TaxID=614101 RepID=A0ABQ9GEN0_9NEOP|nr:hypothetical protein PR048_027162 [Dryococelus australis]